VCARIGLQVCFGRLVEIPQAIDFQQISKKCRLAHNLNVAVQPAAGDAVLATSKMDFRSNEAGRTAPWKITRFSRGQNPFPR
jgi:hypothetical protein